MPGEESGEVIEFTVPWGLGSFRSQGLANFQRRPNDVLKSDSQINENWTMSSRRRTCFLAVAI